jgi:hypothetical protein
VRGTQRLVAAAAVLLGALLLVTLSARSDRADTLTPAPRAAGGTLVPVTSAPAAATESPGAAGDPADGTWPTWLLWFAAAVFVAPILLGLVFLRSLVWRPLVRLTLRRRRGPPADPVAPLDDDVPAGRIAAALDEGLRELDQGGPGEGVVASWVLLERAAADAGTHRAAPETPSELAARVIDRHQVSSGPLLRLADLYREARFSRHELTEADRAEARAVLRRLRAELDASPIGGRR